MANFTRKEYEAKHVSTRSNNNSDRAQVTFLGSLLNIDGSSVVVRFPYHSIDDIVYTTVHTVMDYPGFSYGKRVQCVDHDCPLCVQGLKQENKVYIKMLAYVQEGSSIVVKNVLWERPAAFADIDLKDAFENYGDLSQRLFKLKRSGVKINTRYNISAIDKDNAIYNNTTCPADFTELDTIDASRIMTKTYEQYERAKHPELAESAPAAPVSHPAPQPAPESVVQPAPQPTVQPAVQPATPSDSGTRQKRYAF